MKRTAPYALLAFAFVTAQSALAHPGDHATMTVNASIAHVLTDPWHVGVALVAALAVAALVLRRIARGRGTRT